MTPIAITIRILNEPGISTTSCAVLPAMRHPHRPAARDRPAADYRQPQPPAHVGDPAMQPCSRCDELRFRHTGMLDGHVRCADGVQSPLPTAGSPR